MPNALAGETSPYLLQHKDNPVDWRPWGPDALGLAKRDQKPIFLSIGYSACHWCHVMEHESFESPVIAAVLNEHFVSIKVDREERPDLDQLYMNAVQALAGRGGWPMSVFLTPDLKPFYGGTYWPPTPRRGMPGFDQVLAAVVDAWRDRRDQALATADELTSRLTGLADPTDGAEGEPTVALLDAAGRTLERTFDSQHGGFGDAPKFPHTMELGLLLRLWRRDGREAWLDMLRLTLDRMAAGGIYDHLGGGFARYSVDDRWAVPHFEKMLYDNALLVGVYIDAHLATGEATFARIARETIDYVLRDMTGPEGCFYSTEDADSAPAFGTDGAPAGHAEEGLFYTWQPEEVRRVLGEDDADVFCRVYNITPIGNFEGRNTLSLPKSITTQAKLMGVSAPDLEREMTAARKKLLGARAERPRPGLDDKVLAAWNGLMIDAMAHAGAALDEPRYVAAAGRAADFVLEAMRDAEGRLLRSWRNGKAKLAAYLDDYAALANGLLTLYEATFDERRLDQSAELMEVVLARFADADGAGGFYYTADDHERLLVRSKEMTDNATPGGNSLAATALVRLAKLTGDERWSAAARQTLGAATAMMERAPMAMGQMLAALDLELGPSQEVLLVGEGSAVQELAAELRRRYLPRAVIAGRLGAAHRSPLLDAAFAGKTPVDGEPTLYVCQNHTCGAPIVGVTAIRAAIAAL
ncbi:MAG: thioredoxin domain-containing protein [Lacipirellulaceae bacterium]